MRTNLFHIVLSAIFLTIGSWKLSAQETGTRSTPMPAVKQEINDSIRPGDTINANIENLAKAATQDTIKPKKSGLDAIIKRSAQNENVDLEKKELQLYDEANLFYKDIELKAGSIIMNYEKDEVFAGRIKDSLGNYSQYPYFKQGSNVVEADSIHFNTVTKKARIWNSRSNQGEFIVKGEITKKENDSVYFIKNARFTTSKNIDNPEYYFLTDKVKLVPGKKVVVGFTNMWIADVPTPLALPFAFFPMTEEAESGFIIPTFGDNSNQGYFLQNGGYYFALSDYYDLAVTGDYYTNGSYGLRFQSTYANRYKYSGNVHIRFENIVSSERGFPDYERRRGYNIQWSHTQDAKANPNSRFAAQVNLGTSKYFQNSLNLTNVGASLVNTMQSSVTYSKTFTTVPQVNLSLGVTHNQNTNTEVINMTLPTLQASVDRIFLFAPADAPKKGFIKNMNLQYNLRGENRIQTTDSLFFKSEMFRDARSGLQHTIPLSTNFKVFRYFSMSAGTSFQETWVLNTIRREFNLVTNKDTLISNVRGFDSFRTYNFSTSIGTTVYGTFTFGEDKKIQAIRHVMRPSVSYSYTPSFDRYWDRYDTDGMGNYVEYSRFQNGLFSAPSQNYSNNLNFAVNNTFEAKVRNDDEESEDAEPKKIMLLNNLNFSTSYDITKDSIRWMPLRITGGTTLLKDKMNVNFGATLNPYALNSANEVIDMWNIDNGGSLFRMTSANITVNYSLSNDMGKSGDRENKDSQTARNGGREDDLFGQATDLSDSRNSMFDEDDEGTTDKTEGGFFNAKLPWDLRLAYSLTYSNDKRQNKITNSSLMVSGNMDVTPRWKLGFSTGYDFVQNGVTFTQLRFERDLLSWRMDFNWVPFGDNTYWAFFIGIKSSVLSDIKWDKRQVPDRQLQ